MSALPPLLAAATAATAPPVAPGGVGASAKGLPGLFAQLLAALTGGAQAEAPPPTAGSAKAPAATVAPEADDLTALFEALDRLLAAEAPDPEQAEAALAQIGKALEAPPPALPDEAPALIGKAEALAARAAPVLPELSHALEKFAARLREVLPQRVAADPQLPLPPEAAKVEAPAPARAEAAPASARPLASPPSPPPEIPAPRPEGLAKAGTEPENPAPAKPLGHERALGDVRFDASLTARPVIAAPAPQGPRLDVPALAVEIVRQVHAGFDRFQLRLDPPELGRIEARLDIDGDRVALKLTVEKAETLDLLQRDARSLERALTQAGFTGDRPTLEFALKQQGPQQQPDEPGFAGPAAPVAEAPATATTYRAALRPGGIDLYA